MSLSISSRWLRWLLIAVAVLAAAFVLLVIDPSGALLFRVVGLIGMALFALSIVTMLLTFRKARKLSPWSLAIGAIVSVLCTWVFFALAGAPLSATAIGLAVAAGAMVGVGWSLTNLLFIDGEAIRARGNIWFLAVWALSLLMTQAATLAGGQTPYAVAPVSFLGMGLAVGNSLGLLARYVRARASISVTGERP
ncbi:MAG: hypothetical protein Q7T45_15010 [Bradyrhizobium sp.]|uniref:hypothetical protein n=1 Tax=Bradyrhizobium sp. TaxID=376 RepID=UPI0027168610|nr:hypothetical protein [Bradyrhizobium sp.]MDO8399121.1 hypothetical protein [Bradyrhizobium sp.]